MQPVAAEPLSVIPGANIGSIFGILTICREYLSQFNNSP